MGEHENLLFVVVLFSAPVALYRAFRREGWSVVAGSLVTVTIAVLAGLAQYRWRLELHRIDMRTLPPRWCSFGLDHTWDVELLAVIHGSAAAAGVFAVKAFGGRWHHAIAAGICLALPSPIVLDSRLVVLLFAVATARAFYRDPHWSLVVLAVSVMTYLQVSINSVYYLQMPNWELFSMLMVLIPVIAVLLSRRERGRVLRWSRAVTVIGILAVVPLSRWFVEEHLQKTEARAMQERMRSRSGNYARSRSLKDFGKN